MEISDTHDKIAKVLSYLYRGTDWKAMSSYKRPRDTVFMDRIRRARNAPDVVQAVQRVARSLSVSTSLVPVEDLETAAAARPDAMTVWREHSDLVAMKASALVRASYQEKTDSIAKNQKTLTEES
jgi:hypothetical protein